MTTTDQNFQNKQDPKNTGPAKTKAPLLWVGGAILSLITILAGTAYPQHIVVILCLAIPILTLLGVLLAKSGRTGAFGLNSVVTSLIVISIFGVLNFVVAKYPLKFDLTKEKRHTLSDQTVKLVKGLKEPVFATYFSKAGQKEQVRSILENYRSFNPKFEIEYADPDREPVRAKQAGIKNYGTLVLSTHGRDTRLEDVTEEKVTNALIKLVKEKSPTLCAIAGHGEKNFTSQDAEGYELARKSLADQSYSVKEINLLQEGKLPESCDAIAILGPTKSFFEPEIKIIKEYLEKGGRAVVALDLNLKGKQYAPELLDLLKDWHVKVTPSLVVDPLSRMLGVDSSVAILATFSKSQPITKDFQGNCAFPFTNPLEIIPGAPSSLHVEKLAETTPKSWAIADLKQLSSGEVKLDPKRDKAGPLIAAIAIEGKQKDSKATQNTRLVVFGSSHFATNNFSRYAGNLDLFLNSVSWTMEDESLISIRAKDEAPSKVELSQQAGTLIFMLTVVFIPLTVAAGGIVNWVVRRRL